MRKKTNIISRCCAHGYSIIQRSDTFGRLGSPYYFFLKILKLIITVASASVYTARAFSVVHIIMM